MASFRASSARFIGNDFYWNNIRIDKNIVLLQDAYPLTAIGAGIVFIIENSCGNEWLELRNIYFVGCNIIRRISSTRLSG